MPERLVAESWALLDLLESTYAVPPILHRCGKLTRYRVVYWCKLRYWVKRCMKGLLHV